MKSTRQYGISIPALLVTAGILGFLAVIAAKVVPEYSEYMDILREVKAVAADSAVSSGSVRDIKTAFAKRADVNYIKSITAEDLDISKDNGQLVISFAYSRKVHLFYNASLLLEFEGSTAAPE
jgi:hypothetical protein